MLQQAGKVEGYEHLRMSVDGVQPCMAASDSWTTTNNCVHEQQPPMPQWTCALSPDSGNGTTSPDPNWPSPPQAVQGYYQLQTAGYQDNMRVPPVYHPGLEPGFPNSQPEYNGLLWTKAALENQCQSYMRFGANNLHATTVARRNERERNRVRHINSTFENLRQHLPCATKKKKLSKVDTLKTAIRYIKHLKTILTDPALDNTDEKSTESRKDKTGIKSEPLDVITEPGCSQNYGVVQKRQSLDSSINSSSSAENLPLPGDGEDSESESGDDDCRDDDVESQLSASPCPVSQDATVVTFLRPSQHFAWHAPSP